MNLIYRDIVQGMPAMIDALRLKPSPTVAMAAKLARNARKMQAALQDYQTAEGVLIDGLRDELGLGEGEASDDFTRRAQELREELLEEPIEVDVRQIGLSDLLRCEEVRPAFEMPTAILFDLSFMFNMEEEVADADEQAEQPVV